MLYNYLLRLEHLLRLNFKASNSKAGYEALIAGLKAIKEMDAQVIEIFLDSRLVVIHVEGRFKAKDPRMVGYWSICYWSNSRGR